MYYSDLVRTFKLSFERESSSVIRMWHLWKMFSGFCCDIKGFSLPPPAPSTNLCATISLVYVNNSFLGESFSIHAFFVDLFFSILLTYSTNILILFNLSIFFFIIIILLNRRILLFLVMNDIFLNLILFQFMLFIYSFVLFLGWAK